MKKRKHHSFVYIAALLIAGCTDSTKPTISPEETEAHLVLNGTSFNFGTETTARTLTISAGEADSLSWMIISKRPWLSFDQIEGVAHSKSDTIRMNISREGLEPGRQTAMFYVIQLPDSQRTLVSVTAEVVAPVPPLVIVSEDSLEFPDGITAKQMVLCNGGEGSYTWSLWPDVTSDWISIRPNSGMVGQEPETLRVRIDSERLIPGRTTGRFGVTTDAGDFTVFVGATIGEVIWSCGFNTQEEFRRNWTGDWRSGNSVLIGGPGDSMSLRPEVAPVVKDIHRIVVRGRMDADLTVTYEYGGWGTRFQNFAIAGRGALKRCSWASYIAYASPNDPDVPVGPLELSIWIPTDFGEGISYGWGTIQLYTLEIWEK